MILNFFKTKNKLLEKDCKITYQYDGLITLEFEKDEDEEVLCEEPFFISNENQFIVKNIDENTITCELDFTSLKKDFFVGEKKFDSLTLNDILHQLLDKVNWTIRNAQSIKSRRTLEVEDESLLSAIFKLEKLYDCTFEFDCKNKILTVVDEGRKRDYNIYKDINLEDFIIKKDTFEHYTRIYGFGKDNMTFESINGGKEYVENTKYNQNIIPAVFRDDRFTDKLNLKKHCEELLEKYSKPLIEYELSIVELDGIKLKLHDIVTFLNHKTKRKEEHRIIEYTRYTEDETKSEIKFINRATNLSEFITHQQDTITTEIQKEIGKYDFKTKFDEDIKKATARFENLLINGYKIETKDGTYYVDRLPKENAKNVLRIGLGGIMGSSNGWDGPYSLAIGNDGSINADRILTGFLDVDRIKANSITADKLTVKAREELTNGFVTEEQLTELKVKQNEIETLISETTAIIENLIKNKTVMVNKNNSFKEVINLEKGKAYNFKFSSKGNCEVYVVFTYKDDKRRYKYKYPKKFIDKRLIGGKYSSTFYSNHILSFKVPEQYKESYIIYKGIEDSEIKDISLGEHIGQYNADRITRLKQDLDGFKLTAENNINKVKSEFNVKADEISSKVKNVENKISTEISQSTNEIKSTVKEMKEDLKQFKNLCKESNKEIKGNDIYFDCEKLLKGQKYKVVFKAKDIENNADYKVYNSDMNYRKISENNAWVFTPSQDITQLNLYNGGGSNPKANIYEVQIFKLNDDPRLEELKSEIKQTSTEISLKVSKKDIVSEINQSAESVKIRANKIELDGDVIANKLTSKRLYGNYIDGAVINGGTIKIGNYGYFRPNSSGFVAVAPRNKYADDGIGMQLSGNADGSPSGLFLFESNDISQGGSHDISQNNLLTVWGGNTMAFKYNGRWQKEGKAICTNKYRNSVIRFSNVNMYAVSCICYGDDGELYFDDGTEGDTHGWFVKTDRSYSDIRLKKNIKICKESGLDLIKKIKFKSFAWKKKAKRKQKKYTKIGIIAQELEKIDDSLVYTEPSGTKCIDDFRLLAVTTKAVQELSKKVEELQLKIKQLEER